MDENTGGWGKPVKNNPPTPVFPKIPTGVDGDSRLLNAYFRLTYRF
jgi:hypothetical protein